HNSLCVFPLQFFFCFALRLRNSVPSPAGTRSPEQSPKKSSFPTFPTPDESPIIFIAERLTLGELKKIAVTGDSLRQTIFVQCEFGRDRRGVRIATYRIAIQKWSPDRARDEFVRFYSPLRGHCWLHVESFFALPCTFVPCRAQLPRHMLLKTLPIFFCQSSCRGLVFSEERK